MLYVSLILIIIYLCFKYFSLKNKHLKFEKFFYKYLNILTSARYGNFNLKCDEGFDDFTNKLSKGTNDFLDSVKDRDKMINEYIEREKQTQNLKEDFVSSLAHDFKVPIIAQDNTYDLLLNGSFGQLSDSQIKAVNNLKISNNDLKNLVLALLDVHKFESGLVEPDFKEMNIYNLIKEVIIQNEPILKIQNKEIVFSYDSEDIICKIDDVLIKRALNNLISNAVFYGKNSKNIYINLSKSSKYVEISVIDEGEGINEKDVKSLFKKYYTSSKKYSNISLGLGLYIVNKIVTSHKGKIIAKNHDGKGACFTIKLPF